MEPEAQVVQDFGQRSIYPSQVQKYISIPFSSIVRFETGRLSVRLKTYISVTIHYPKFIPQYLRLFV